MLFSIVLPSPILSLTDLNTLALVMPKVEIQGGKFQGFEIYMKKGGDKASISWILKANISADSQTYVVNELEPGMQYTFRVCGQVEPGGHRVCSSPGSTVTPYMGKLQTLHFDHLNTSYFIIGLYLRVACIINMPDIAIHSNLEFLDGLYICRTKICWHVSQVELQCQLPTSRII